MANFKKGLALVLAAATAFTFAPVASLTAPVQAEASSALVKGEDITLVVGETKTYTVQNLAQYADNSTVSVKSSDATVAGVTTTTGAGVTATTQAAVTGLKKTNEFKVVANKAGTATITVSVDNTNGAVITETFTVTVVGKAESISAKAVVNGKDVDATQGITLGTSGTQTITLTSKNFDKNDWTVQKIGDTTSAGVFTVTPTTKGDVSSVTLTVTGGTKAETGSILVTNKDAAGYAQTLTIPVTVVKNTQTLTVKYDADGDGVLDTATDKTVAGTFDQVLYLDDVTKTAKIEATSDFGTVVTFKSNNSLVTVDNAGNVALNGAAKDASAVITVEAAATTLSGAAVAKVTKKINVTVSAKAKTLASVKNSAGKVLSFARATTGAGVTAGTNNTSNWDDPSAAIVLSLKDKKTDSISVSSNVGDAYVIVESDKPSVVTYANGTLTAVAKGKANIVVTVKNSAATEGTLKFTIPVEVVDVNAKEIITATTKSVSLNKTNTTAQVSATTTYGSAVSYALVDYNETTKTYGPSASAGVVAINSATGLVTYVNQKVSGSTFIELSTPAHANTRLAAEKVYIPLTYSAVKDASDLKAASVLNLKKGETGSVNATASGKITYVSDNEAVATVSTDGTVTAVAAGVANITVSAEATDKFEAGKVVVPVVVTEKAKTVAKPAKVTGVKVTNVKGAKVKVSFKKVSKAAGYVVTYKVGKKTYKKTITSTSTKLSVKKGAKVTVTVKAFNYKDGNVKQFGAASKAVSKKTDKK